MDHPWTTWTARLALALYFVALAGFLTGPAGRFLPWIRISWTAGCLVFLAHVFCAFQEVHGWSHRGAFAHVAHRTEEFAGISTGAGLYLNYVFTAAWTADVVWWWTGPASYRRRPRWLSGSLHGFFAFMAFNATVVFGSGIIRWAGLGGCVLLVCLWRHGHRRRSS